MIDLPIADSARPTSAYDDLLPDNLAPTRDNLKISLGGNELR
jgi:hypothetical protein